MAKAFAAAISMAVLALLLHASATYPSAAAKGDSGRFLEKLQIKDLAVAYSLAVDSISVGKPLSVAKELLATAFRSNAIFVFEFYPGDPFTVEGLDNIVTVAQGLFAARQSFITEHMIGTQSVKFLSSTEAKLNSYFSIQAKSVPDAIDYYSGNYTDTVVKTKGEWKIAKRIAFTFNALTVQGTEIRFQ